MDSNPGSQDPQKGSFLKQHAPKWLREAGKPILRGAGVLSSPLRELPDFLIIGTKRGGTTSLWNYLLQHPDVLPMFPADLNLKSPHYFYWHYRRGPAWYRAHFATTATKSRHQRSTGVRPVSGEASPYYLYNEYVPRRVAELMPDVKLVVMLRDPVRRAYSHYWERVDQGVERLSFEDALRAEAGRIAGERERMNADPLYYSRAHDWYTYRDRGVYAPQLRRWFNHFPREQFVILASEDFYADPGAVVDVVTTHLGVRTISIPTRIRHNYRPAPPIPPDAAAELTEFYRPHNAALYELLGRDFNWP